MKTRRNVRRRQRGGVLKIISKDDAKLFRTGLPIADSVHDFGGKSSRIEDFLIKKMREEMFDDTSNYRDDVYEQLGLYQSSKNFGRMFPTLNSSFEHTIHNYILKEWDEVILNNNEKILEKFKEIYLGLFAEEFSPDIKIDIICDSGPNEFGKLLAKLKFKKIINDPRLIVTPTTISDSAKSVIQSENFLKIGGARLGVKYFKYIPFSEEELIGELSNYFEPTVKIEYEKVEQIESKLTPGVEDPEGNINAVKIIGLKFIQKIGNHEFLYAWPEHNADELTRGPSVNELSRLFIDKTTGTFIKSQYPQKSKNRLPIMKKIFESNITRGSLLDIKRCGDWHQVRTAMMLHEMYKRFNRKIIFCTGDELCATYAVLNGLPTIFQKDNVMRFHSKSNLIISTI